MWNQPDPVATWLIFGSVWALIALRAVYSRGVKTGFIAGVAAQKAGTADALLKKATPASARQACGDHDRGQV
jgi:hypothetical protein